MAPFDRSYTTFYHQSAIETIDIFCIISEIKRGIGPKSHASCPTYTFSCPSSVCPSSVLVVISHKLSKISPSILRVTLRIEVGIDDSVPRFRSSLRRHPGEIFSFQIQHNVQTLIAPLLRLWRQVRPQLLSTEHDRRHTAGVVNCYQHSATVVTCC